jgi:hypothetical protein
LIPFAAMLAIILAIRASPENDPDESHLFELSDLVAVP